MRRAHFALTGAVVLVAAGIACSDDSFTGGEFTTTGRSSSVGEYTSTLKFERQSDGSFCVTDTIDYTRGGHSHFSGTAQLSGSTLEVTGPVMVGIVGKLTKKHPDTWHATYTIGADGSLASGTWFLSKAGVRGSETVTGSKENPPSPADANVTPAPQADLLVLLDGDGKEVAKDKKNTDGVLLAVNLDDDDNDGGAGGDGDTKIVSDKDDTDGVPGEDDLLAFKLVRPQTATADSKFVLTFSDKLAVWRTKDKMPGSRIRSGEKFDAADATLYFEGIDAGNETVTVTLQSGGKSAAQDTGKVLVAHSAFLLLGHGNAGSWSLQSWLDKNKADSRTNPVLVRGKDESGKPCAWAVYIWNTEKQAKIALSTPGAAIAYDGHSNFGLGYAFETHFTSVKQFMNIADAQVPVNWEYLRDHQDHPGLMFEDSEYGDDSSTTEFSDPVGVDRYIDGTKDKYYTRRWPEAGDDSGTRYHLVRGKDYKWQDYHYLLDNDKENARIVVKAGAKDMPAKKWGKLYLNSCYSGPYYFDSFGGHGTLFYTTEESASPETSAIFLECCIQGASNDATMKALNKAENINDYHVFGN